MRDVFIALSYLTMLAMGAVAPFAFTLGYLWVDTFAPQYVAYGILNWIPVSFVMGACAVGAYVLADRRSPPRPSLQLVLVLLMAAWVTASLTWAVVPGFAEAKWNWAFKTIVFSAFIPFAIRSRVQIEAFLQVYIFSLAAQIVPFGLKTLVSGGGYGQNYGVIGGNSGLSEGSTVAVVAVMMIPVILALWRHTLLVSPSRLRAPIYCGLVLTCITAAIGTYERTALVSGAVVVGAMWLRSRRKVLFTLGILAIGGALGAWVSTSWVNRIQTIEGYETEGSAYTRILVWKWTLDFVGSHPLGGGFNSYVINEIQDTPTPANPNPLVQHGRAFHSIYFEMLGEQGWPGLAMFLTLMLSTALALRRVQKRARRRPELAWCGDLAGALLCALLSLMAGGAFVGIAFQPMLWDIFALGTCLSSYVRRAERQAPATARPSFAPPIGLTPSPGTVLTQL